MKKVSIIIPCYNGGRYLREAVESALNQTYQNKEIIIVNDGSTDGETLSVLRELEKFGTVRIIHQENKGLASARNTGAAVSSGEYMCCLDDDDSIELTYIEKCIEIFKTNTRIGFVYSDVRLFGDIDKVWRTGEYDAYRLLFRNNIPVSAVFRKICWEAVGGYNPVMDIGYEDWDFWIGIVEKGWMGKWIPETLFKHRKHGKTMTSRALDAYGMLYKKIRSNHVKFFSRESVRVLRTQSVLSAREIFFIRTLCVVRILISKIKGFYNNSRGIFCNVIHELKWKIPVRMRVRIRNGILFFQEKILNKENSGSSSSASWRTGMTVMGQSDGSRGDDVPSISVVVPVYDHDGYLKDCIESILSQDYDLFELILVNDDPDNFKIKNILEKYRAYPKVKIIENEKNIGISASLNVGILESKGEYIAFVDCDDMLVSGALLCVTDAICRGEEKYYISSQIVDIDERGRIISKRPRSQQPKDLLRGMFAGHLKVVKREVFETVGLFNSAFDGCQDYDFVLRVQEKFPIHFLQKYLYYYRWHEGSQTLKNIKRQKDLADLARREARRRRALD